MGDARHLAGACHGSNVDSVSRSRVVSKLLGHSKVSTTSRYLAVVDGERHAAVATMKLPPSADVPAPRPTAHKREGGGSRERFEPTLTVVDIERGRAMRGVWVRYRDGSTDEWKVKETMRLAELVDYFRSAFRNQTFMAFSTASEGNALTDFDVVGINLADVVAWWVIGLDQPHQESALWDELERLSDDNDDDENSL
jgi:hypothetical protein